MLGKLCIQPSDIAGYETDEFTHVAVAVASGAADVGIGVLSAARALDPHFIPVTSERYDLIIPEVFFETPLLLRLLEVIRSTKLTARVAELGGYGTTQAGQVIG